MNLGKIRKLILFIKYTYLNKVNDKKKKKNRK